MAIVYRTAGAWGAGKGSDLTPAEVDGNFYDHNGRIVTLEAAGGVTVTSITIVGNDLTFHYSDSSEQTVTLPAQSTWTFTGAWQPSTEYSINDIITVSGSVYVVTYDHTSGSTFDPDANDGSGHDYYGLLVPNIAVPVFTVTDTTFTPDTSYANSYIRCTNAGGCAVTIPSNASEPFSVDTELNFRQAGAGAITFDTESPATINGLTGYSNETAVQGAVVTLKKIATDSWDLFGLLAR